VLLVAATLVAGLLTPTAARAEQFRYHYRPGQRWESRAGLAGAMMVGQPGSSMAKMQFRVSIKQSQRVASVSGGIVTLEITETPLSGRMTAMGKTQSYPRTATRSVVKMTERGRFISRKSLSGEGADSGAPGMQAVDAIYGLNFPDRDLKPGDTWEDTVTIGEKESAQKVHVTSRFAGREVFRGRECAKFSTLLSMPMAAESGAPASGDAPGQGKATGNLTTYFDPKAGMEVYQSGSLAVLARADLSGISPGAGDFASVSKINIIQSLVSGAARNKH
jgi:hypothetical protein